jgi:hypothetical protein
MQLPTYPIYIPSKGRADRPLTQRCLLKEGVPFYCVVEATEYDAYAAVCGPANVLVLPFSDRGLTAARNWIKAHATAAGHSRHWQLDDNLYSARRLYRGVRAHCPMGVALRVTEDLADRYTNVAIAGITYEMFGIPRKQLPPFFVNVHVYSCSLILNSLPHQWRPTYNDDTDICLQVLADGWCTILVNAFTVKKVQTLTMHGGNHTTIYRGDGRLAMARSLERDWPGVVTVSRRYHRPQHIVGWQKFDTPLKRRTDIDWTAFTQANDYGLVLRSSAAPAVADDTSQ